MMNNFSLPENRIEQRNRAAEKKKYWLRLTNACNNNCIFCLDGEALNGTYRSPQDIKTELRKGIDEKAQKLILSGGEPTIHPDFLGIVKLAKNIGYAEIQVISNGRMFYYQDFLEKVVANGVTEITFSIHGHAKNIYEKQSRIKGSYKQALLGLLNALKTKDLIVNMDIVINKINYKYLEDILRFFIKLGVSEFDLLQIVPFGRAWQNKKEVFYDLEKAMPYLRRVFTLQFEFPNVYIWTNRFPPQYLEGFEELIQHPIKLYDEVRGRKNMFNEFIEKNKIMSCFGEQCNYCFLKNFCADLVDLKNKKEIVSKRIAFCLKFNKEQVRRFEFNGKIDINKFLNFYISYRYFLKSLRCRNCKYFNYCAGIPINLIRKKGFKTLTPIK